MKLKQLLADLGAWPIDESMERNAEMDFEVVVLELTSGDLIELHEVRFDMDAAQVVLSVDVTDP